MRLPIRVKLIVAILLPLLAVYLGVLALNYRAGKEQAIRQAQRHLSELASHHAARLDGRFVVAEQAAQSVAGVIAEHQPEVLPRRVDMILTRSLTSNPVLHGACLALEPGEFGQPKRFGRFAYRVARPQKPGPVRRAATRSAAPLKAHRPPSRPAPRRPARRPARRPDPLARALTTVLRRGDLARADPTFYREAWYEQARLAGTAVWTEPHAQKALGAAVICRCSTPLLHEEEFQGVVAFDIAVAPLQKYVSRTKLEGGYCIVVSRSGLLVCHPRADVAMKQSLSALADKEQRPELKALADRLTAGDSGVYKMAEPGMQRPTWVVFAPIRTPGWTFAAMIPEAQIMGPVYARLWRDTLVMLVGLSVIIVLVLLVSINITRPIRRLARGVRKLADGDLDAQVEGVQTSDEIGEFAGAFNRMVTDLKDHVEALTRETVAREAVESELRVAREIQSALLPHRFPAFPDRREFDLHAMHVPAKQVAGDFFDYFFLDEDRLAFLIADVSGKGAPAALFMAVSRTVIRNQAVGGAPPADVLAAANRLLAQDNERGMFVTVFFAHYDTRTGQLTYASAGHNPPCVGSAQGTASRLAGGTGLLLGVFEDAVYEQRRIEMAPRDTLLLYTDGVTEALDRGDRQFGLSRLEGIVAGNGHCTPEELCGLLVQTVEEYRAHPQQDDITLLALRRNG